MDGIPDDEGKDTNGGKEILENPVTRDDIELESIDSKNIHGLWNSPESRAVFYEIVNSEFLLVRVVVCCRVYSHIMILSVFVSDCETTGMLALAFDLLCRNTMAFLSAHKLLNVKAEPKHQPSTRSTRRMNAWQQANQ